MQVEFSNWKRASELLDELMDLDADARDARLAQLRDDDHALAAELQSLLSRRTAVDREAFLEDGPLQIHAGLEGLTLGGYTLESCIGQGGMGSVWRARRSDGRYEGMAAIKFLNLALMAGRGTERFRREGSFLARLAHPNIARLLDAGVSATRQPYLVLEYVEGIPIDAWCDARRADVEARLRIFIDVLEAVSYAHSHLIVHRDLKPSNIFVTTDGRVKLLDFGIAKLLDADDAGGTAGGDTLATERAFTPDFAAPEQLQGGVATTATDVYALGALLYLLLTGRHPTAPSAGTLVERLHATVHVEPARPSVAVLRATVDAPLLQDASKKLALARAATPSSLAHALRGDLDTIVAKALKKDPSQRYATPAAMAEDLRRYFRHQPIAARADALGYRAAKFVVRNRWALGAAAGIALSLSIGTGLAVWKSIEADERRSQAELDAKRATASLDLVYLVFSDADAMSARTMKDRLANIHRVILQNSDDPRVKLMLLERLGGRYMELGAIDETLALLAELRALARSVDDPSELASIACGFANIYVIPGRYDEAEAEIATARTYLARLRSDDMSARAECWQAEAELAMLRGQPERALRVSELSVATFERLGQTRDTTYMSALNQLALGRAAIGDYRASYRTTLKARAALQQLGLGGTQQDLTIALQEVEMLAAGGQPLAASRLLTGLRSDPHVAVEHQIPQFALDQRAGSIALKLGRPADAAAALDASVVEARDAGNALFIQTGTLRLVEALVADRRIGAAQSRLAALPGVDEEIGRGTPKGGRYLAVKATIALAQGDAPAADELASRSLQVLSRAGASAPRLRETLLVAARAAMARQDWDRALRHAQAAVDRARAEAIDPASSSAVGEALLVQAQAQAGRGRRAAAASLASEARPQLEGNLGAQHPLAAAARALASSGA